MQTLKLRLWQASLLVLIAFVLAACGGSSTADTTPVPTPDLDIPIEELLVYVPAGSFFMGSQEQLDTLARPDEFPQHQIVLDGFHIYRNEVSNGLYAQCVAAGQCTQPQVIEDEEGPSNHYGEEEYKDHPVVGVTWDQAVAFCTWVDARLPTEAEWEKTSRGELGDLYPWGNDAPTCDLNNMESCIPETLTEKIGQYPGGESLFEAEDMAGNVWEWTADWYNPDYYAVSTRTNPLGPENGELKTVRGGSYENGPVDLRSAARLGLDPDEAYNNVGFRCVPIGLPSPGTAPFCQPNYVPFCADPNNPNGDCTPPTTGEGGTPDEPDFDWLGFTCPDGGYITFTIDAGGPAADDYEVSINGVTYDCVDSTVNPGRMVCTGTAQTQNTFVTISVCPNDQANTGSQLVSLTPTPDALPDRALVAFDPAPQPQAVQLVAFQPAQPSAGLQAFQPAAQNAAPLVAFQAAAATYCPDGYVYNPTTQQCESNPNGACPDGWAYDEASGQCTPPDQGACPDGTSYNPDQQGCTPDDGSSCPAPYIYDEASGLCQPPANNDGGGACPAGYFYDENILCCSPVQGGNNGCAEGTFRSVATGACEPLDQNGCPDGTVYNRYEGTCVPTTNPDGQGDTPVTQRTVGGCAQDQYFDPASQQCINFTDGGCGAGYYYDANMQTCRPTDGPNSGCAIGYAFNVRLNCCVGTPGNDGSTCAGDPQSGQELRSFTGLAAPSLTGYDAGGGYCDPGQNGCPNGTTYDEATGTCQPLAGAAQPPNPESLTCSEGYYYDEYYGLCLPNGFEPTGDGCGEGQYYDYNLGYCVQTSCGCALGFTFNYDTQTCEPTGQPTSSGCWTTTQSVPTCEFQPEPTPVCGRGETYHPSTGTCDRTPPDGQTASCGGYSNQTACKSAGCNWFAVVGGAGAAGFCY